MNLDDSLAYNETFKPVRKHAKISVRNPQKNANQVVFYTVCAYDRSGAFECQRRFSEFERLREAWRRRIPGLYLPFLPPKKIFGNTEKLHLEERAFLLEQFLLKVSKISYLSGSDEFHLFARYDSLAGPPGLLKMLD